MSQQLIHRTLSFSDGVAGDDPSPVAGKLLADPAGDALAALSGLDARPGEQVLIHADGDVLHRTNFVFHELRVKRRQAPCSASATMSRQTRASLRKWARVLAAR
ncbi:MAG TPA: hypothetical protein VFX95_01030, partial [Caulobacteraceae bacterium]|nr:hypothetical protein [Caulobacteraceae bacterium]